MTLFRQQVLEQQYNRLQGEVLLLPKTSHSLVIGLLLCWLIVTVVWLTSSSFSRKETVRGWLEPASGVIRVYPHSTGVVKTLLVKEGSWVEKGDHLVVINGDRVLASGSQLEELLLHEYDSQKNLLQQQLNRVTSITQQQLRDLEKKIDSAKQELILLDAQADTFRRRETLLKKQVARYQSLHRQGYIAWADLESVTDQELKLASDLQDMRRRQLIQAARLQELNTRYVILPQEAANDKVHLQQRLSDLAQKIAQLDGQSAYTLKAPRSGFVNNLQLQEGQQADTTRPILTVVPKTNALNAYILVPVRAAGFLQSGQELSIRYDAFPYQKFGAYKGKVIEVSSSILLASEVADTPVNAQEPMYRLRASLSENAVNAYGDEFALKPGMTFSADIRLSERSVMEWLLEPILRLKGNMM